MPRHDREHHGPAHSSIPDGRGSLTDEGGLGGRPAVWLGVHRRRGARLSMSDAGNDPQAMRDAFGLSYDPMTPRLLGGNEGSLHPGTGGEVGLREEWSFEGPAGSEG